MEMLTTFKRLDTLTLEQNKVSQEQEQEIFEAIAKYDIVERFEYVSYREGNFFENMELLLSAKKIRSF